MIWRESQRNETKRFSSPVIRERVCRLVILSQLNIPYVGNIELLDVVAGYLIAQS